MEVPHTSIQAHIRSVIRKLTAFLEYQGIVQNKESIKFMEILRDTQILNVS
jgi:hypothetical protein